MFCTQFISPGVQGKPPTSMVSAGGQRGAPGRQAGRRCQGAGDRQAHRQGQTARRLAAAASCPCPSCTVRRQRMCWHRPMCSARRTPCQRAQATTHPGGWKRHQQHPPNTSNALTALAATSQHVQPAKGTSSQLTQDDAKRPDVSLLRSQQRARREAGIIGWTLGRAAPRASLNHPGPRVRQRPCHPSSFLL